jgi:hypothetical protein
MHCCSCRVIRGSTRFSACASLSSLCYKRINRSQFEYYRLIGGNSRPCRRSCRSQPLNWDAAGSLSGGKWVGGESSVLPWIGSVLQNVMATPARIFLSLKSWSSMSAIAAVLGRLAVNIAALYLIVLMEAVPLWPGDPSMLSQSEQNFLLGASMMVGRSSVGRILHPFYLSIGPFLQAQIAVQMVGAIFSWQAFTFLPVAYRMTREEVGTSEGSRKARPNFHAPTQRRSQVLHVTCHRAQPAQAALECDPLRCRAISHMDHTCCVAKLSCSSPCRSSSWPAAQAC